MLSTKPSRNAAARPGRSSGSVTVRNVVQPRARSVCEASSSDGLMPCTTPSSTRNAIGVKASSCANATPAGRRSSASAGCRTSRTAARDRAGAAEQQDQRQADDERRRDDRQHAHHAQHALEAERGARGDQREGEAEQRGAGADDDGEEHRVPGHAAAQAGVQAVDAPDRAVEEARDETGRLRTRCRA